MLYNGCEAHSSEGLKKKKKKQNHMTQCNKWIVFEQTCCRNEI